MAISVNTFFYGYGTSHVKKYQEYDRIHRESLDLSAAVGKIDRKNRHSSKCRLMPMLLTSMGTKPSLRAGDSGLSR